MRRVDVVGGVRESLKGAEGVGEDDRFSDTGAFDVF